MMREIILGKVIESELLHPDTDGVDIILYSSVETPVYKTMVDDDDFAKMQSQFVGVRSAYGGKWCSQIRINGKTKHLGTFTTEKEAAEAYQSAQSAL